MGVLDWTATGMGTAVEPGNLHVKGRLQTDLGFHHDTNGSAVYCKRITITLGTNTAAGVFSGSVTLPATSTLLNIVVHAVALWNQGTSATLIVGDNTDPDGYFTAVDMKATDLLAGESIDFIGHGGKAGAYIVGTLPTGHWESRYQAASRTVQAELTTVGTAATTGETVIDVYFSLPETPDITAASYAAT